VSRFLVASCTVGFALLLAATANPAAQPPFYGSAQKIDPGLRARMTSWHRGCPVAIDDLRLISASYWGFDGRVHEGKLIVVRTQAQPVLRVLRALFAARFPIRRMRLVEAYGSNDDRSMAADNTSGFNCRRVEGSRSWSEHAYGRAIDINPLENPELNGRQIMPPAGARYVDRSRSAMGMIHGGGVVVRAFASIGWHWGGYWHSLKDYQHFSATGR
jgi:hypothetical protein